MFHGVKVKQRDGCTLYFQQGRVMCKVEGTAQTVPLFPALAAARLMMDKSSLRVRVVLEEQNQPFCDLQFSKEGDREAFAVQLKQAKAAVKQEREVSASQPVTSLQAPPNVKSENMMTSAIKREDGLGVSGSTKGLTHHLDVLFCGARGILSLYSVLDDWVDVAAMTSSSSSTSTPAVLKPLTDQMIADAFAAVPTLAAAHETLVTKRGLTEKEFWEAVVNKYLCFKSTPLDGLVGAASGSSALTLAGSGTADGNVEAYMRFINSASAKPLRGVRGKRSADNDDDGDADANATTTAGVNDSVSQAAAIMSLGRCFPQPSEVPCTLLANPTFVPPLRANQLLSLEGLREKVARAGSSACSEVAFDSSAAAFPSDRDLWVQFWQYVDASQFDRAEEALKAIEASLPTSRRNAILLRRAASVLGVCR